MRIACELSLGGRGGASGSGALAPPEGMVHWYDFSDSDNYTFSDPNITAATDIGSNGAATLTSAAGKYPIVGTINGVNAAHFDGTDDILKTTTGLDNAFDADGAAYTQAVVFQLDAIAFGSGTASGLFTMARRSTVDPYVGLLAAAPTDNWGWLLRDESGNFATVYQAGQDTDPHVMVAVIRTDETADLWLDGTKVVDGTSIATAASRILDQHLALGGLSFTTSSEDWPLDGKIGEALAYASALSDSDVGELNAYLMDKWGIS